MSEVAGRMAPQVGAKYLEKPHGGRGILLGGVPGVPPAKVVVIGGGIVGYNAARIARRHAGRRDDPRPSVDRLRYLDEMPRTAASLSRCPHASRSRRRSPTPTS